jgi:hypothetical protein
LPGSIRWNQKLKKKKFCFKKNNFPVEWPNIFETIFF